MPASKKAGITRTRPTWRSQRSCAATVSWFIPLPVGTRGRLLDPCAGEGEIASLLGRLHNCETLRSEPRGEAWGCELFPYRAEKVAARIDKCHIAVWDRCSLMRCGCVSWTQANGIRPWAAQPRSARYSCQCNH